MKLSKSILTRPIRATRDGGAITLSFFRRRLRLSANGGQAPPFFTKKRGPTLENPEPSSPKVTCIGQVRVKSKKRVNQCRSLSKRRINGEVSFRKIEQSQESQDKVICSRSQRYSNGGGGGGGGGVYQRWVHLPISVCDALRALGAEFSCLFPCKSSCFSMRWLVPVNEGGGGRGRGEIEVVVGGGEAEETMPRRHVFQDIEVKDDRVEVKGQSLEVEEEGEEEARLSISIPPKNALLLMRCRSDPMQMAALANRFSFDAKCEDQTGHFHGVCEGKDEILEALKREVDVSVKLDEEQKIKNEAEAKLEMEEKEQDIEAILLEEEEEEEHEEIESNMSSFEALLDQEKTELSTNDKETEQETEDTAIDEKTEEPEKDEQIQEAAQIKSDPQKTHDQEDEKAESEAGNPKNQELGMNNQEIIIKKSEKESPVLPECLLLMMYEPKLSMEVSKETWVRSTDFIRWRPERPRKAAKGGGDGCDHEQVQKKPSNIDSKPKPSVPLPPPAEAKKKNGQPRLQPPRSSCSLPAAASMATMIEKKLGNEAAGAYEPFALTRCKSEPMKTAAEKLGVGF